MKECSSKMRWQEHCRMMAGSVSMEVLFDDTDFLM